MILASLSSKGQFDIFVELGGVGGVGGGDGPLVEGGGDSSQGEKALPYGKKQENSVCRPICVSEILCKYNPLVDQCLPLGETRGRGGSKECIQW